MNRCANVQMKGVKMYKLITLKSKYIMAMFRDRKVNRKWRRVFRTLFAILALCLIQDLLPLNEEIATFLIFAGLASALAGLVFLWFVYNSPETLKMQEEENDMFNNN